MVTPSRAGPLPENPTMSGTGENTQEDRWLTEAISRLRAALDPSTIVLSGSRARGTATHKSDVDLLISLRDDGPACGANRARPRAAGG
jgi:hypothetical protein